MNIEMWLSTLVGSVVRHLHMAHSRNDQVAVDFRLCIREAVQKVAQALKEFIKQLLALVEKHVKTFLLSFTHLQLVQPVTLGHYHYRMAYVEMFGRDLSRMHGCH